MDIKELIERVRLTDEGDIYDADCGQELCCDILPKYLSGRNLENCYLEISKVVQTFVDGRVEAQLNKVLNDPDLYVIDRNEHQTACPFCEGTGDDRNDSSKECQCCHGEGVRKQKIVAVIPLREATKEAQE